MDNITTFGNIIVSGGIEKISLTKIIIIILDYQSIGSVLRYNRSKIIMIFYTFLLNYFS